VANVASRQWDAATALMKASICRKMAMPAMTMYRRRPSLPAPTISPDNRKQFESMGIEAVRVDLLRGFEVNERIARGPARQEALDWLAEQDGKQRRRETIRYWSMVVLTAIAAFAACIAAWPIVKG
jgi:hypothetical protein